MSRKSKGINAERELIHKFWAVNGWAAVRVAGSGSMKYPSADILAGNSIRKLAIESKVINDTKKYFTEEEIKDLKDFSTLFGAEPWLAIKFKKEQWFFIPADDVEKTETNLVVSLEMTKRKGLLFEELLRY
ncbi:Holliday junction resolvase [Candidatus Woesearchaeota archaeon]|nr:Holliday junction resolvase [Candidatus Woesearchaeota archaeon]